MEYVVKEKHQFKYIDRGKGETLVLLHGLFGELSNWSKTIECFSKEYRVIIPSLPIHSLPIASTTLNSLVEYIASLLDYLNIEKVTMMGNSLGGHLALLYCMKNPDRINKLVLTASSGLFENTMGGSYPKRGNYQYIKEKTEYTFYNPKCASKELVDNVFGIVSDMQKCKRIIMIARSAQKQNISKKLHVLKMPTLLVWGLNDTITPPRVAHEFFTLIPNTSLHFIDKCGHAPMMEHPTLFNKILHEFLVKIPVSS